MYPKGDIRKDFEYVLAGHCAPTLLSQKCASLVSLSRQCFPDLSFLCFGKCNSIQAHIDICKLQVASSFNKLVFKAISR
mgnify:CR=1 FL=1